MEKCPYCNLGSKSKVHIEICSFIDRCQRERHLTSSLLQREADRKRNAFLIQCSDCKLLIDRSENESLTIQIKFCQKCLMNITTVKKSKHCLYFY